MNAEARYTLAATLLNYIPATGEFTWREARANNKVKAGQRAGSVNEKGLLAIGMPGGAIQAHLLAWRLSGKGPIPVGSYVGHANGTQTDNRPQNLMLMKIKGRRKNG